jgi:hypothetical protein
MVGIMRNTMMTLVAAALGLVLARVPAGALELAFRVTSGASETTYTEAVHRVPGGYRAVVKSPLEESTMEMDDAFQTLFWTFRVPADGTDLSAKRTAAAIAVSGRFKSRPFEKTFDTGGAPWYEYQELSLDAFGTGSAPGIMFATIDRATMKLVRFRAQKKGPAEIDFQGRKVSAVESVLLVEGIPELLLRSRLWQRQSDGRYLRLLVPPFGGVGASTLIELAGESGTLTE